METIAIIIMGIILVIIIIMDIIMDIIIIIIIIIITLFQRKKKNQNMYTIPSNTKQLRKTGKNLVKV